MTVLAAPPAEAGRLIVLSVQFYTEDVRIARISESFNGLSSALFEGSVSAFDLDHELVTDAVSQLALIRAEQENSFIFGIDATVLTEQIQGVLADPNGWDAVRDIVDWLIRGQFVWKFLLKPMGRQLIGLDMRLYDQDGAREEHEVALEIDEDEVGDPTPALISVLRETLADNSIQSFELETQEFVLDESGEKVFRRVVLSAQRHVA